MDKVEQMDKKTRYFRCMYNDEVFGRYSGKTPKQAANKALTSIIKSNGGNTNCVDKKFNFILKECTRGYKSKDKNYEGSRKKLDKPIIVNISNGETKKHIEYQYLNKVKYIKKY